MLGIFDPVVKQILDLLTQQVEASNKADPAHKVSVGVMSQEFLGLTNLR